MATPVTTEVELGGSEGWRGSGDALLAAFESLLQEVDTEAEGISPPATKWSSEELLASCQALLDDAREALMGLEVRPSNPDHHPPHARLQQSPTHLRPPPSSPASPSAKSPLSSSPGIPSGLSTSPYGLSWSTPATVSATLTPTSVPSGTSSTGGVSPGCRCALGVAPPAGVARPGVCGDSLSPEVWVMSQSPPTERDAPAASSPPPPPPQCLTTPPSPPSSGCRTTPSSGHSPASSPGSRPGHRVLTTPSPTPRQGVHSSRLQRQQQKQKQHQQHPQQSAVVAASEVGKHVSPGESSPQSSQFILEQPAQQLPLLDRKRNSSEVDHSSLPQGLKVNQSSRHGFRSPEALVLERSPPREALVLERSPSPEALVLERSPSPEALILERSPSPEALVLERSPSEELSPSQVPPVYQSTSPSVPVPEVQCACVEKLSSDATHLSALGGQCLRSQAGVQAGLFRAEPAWAWPGPRPSHHPPRDQWGQTPLLSPERGQVRRQQRCWEPHRHSCCATSPLDKGREGEGSCGSCCVSPTTASPAPSSRPTLTAARVNSPPHTTSSTSAAAIASSSTCGVKTPSLPTSLSCSHDDYGISCTAPPPAGVSATSGGYRYTCGSYTNVAVTAGVVSPAHSSVHTCPVSTHLHTPLPALSCCHAALAASGHCKEASRKLHELDDVSFRQNIDQLFGEVDGIGHVCPRDQQVVNHPLATGLCSVSSSCSSMDRMVVAAGESLFSESEDDESVFSFTTCSSCDHEWRSEGGGSCIWCSCGEASTTTTTTTTDGDSDYSLGRFAPSCEDLWQWNPSYEDDDQGSERVFVVGDDDSDTGTVASQVLLGGSDAAHCQVVAPSAVGDNYSVSSGDQTQACGRSSEGSWVVEGNQNTLLRVEEESQHATEYPNTHTQQSSASRCGTGRGGAECLSLLPTPGANDVLLPVLAGNTSHQLLVDAPSSLHHSTLLQRCPSSPTECVRPALCRRLECVADKASVEEGGSVVTAGGGKDGPAPPPTPPPVPDEPCRHHQVPPSPSQPIPSSSYAHKAFYTVCSSHNNGGTLRHLYKPREHAMMADIFSDCVSTAGKVGPKRVTVITVDDPDPGGSHLEGPDRSEGCPGSGDSDLGPSPGLVGSSGPTSQDHRRQGLVGVAEEAVRTPLEDVSASDEVWVPVSASGPQGQVSVPRASCPGGGGPGSVSDMVLQCDPWEKTSHPPISHNQCWNILSTPHTTVSGSAATPAASVCVCSSASPGTPCASLGSCDACVKASSFHPYRPSPTLPFSCPQQLPQQSLASQLTGAHPTSLLEGRNSPVVHSPTISSSVGSVQGSVAHPSRPSVEDYAGGPTLILADVNGQSYSSGIRGSGGETRGTRRKEGGVVLGEEAGPPLPPPPPTTVPAATTTTLLQQPRDAFMPQASPQTFPSPPAPPGEPASSRDSSYKHSNSGASCLAWSDSGRDRSDSGEQDAQEEEEEEEGEKDWGVVHALPAVVVQDLPHHHDIMPHHSLPPSLPQQPLEQPIDHRFNLPFNKLLDLPLDQSHNQLTDQSSDQLIYSPHGQLTDQLNDQLTGQLTGQLRDQPHDKLTGQSHDQLTGQSQDQLTGQVHEQLSGQFHGQPHGQLTGFPPEDMSEVASSSSPVACPDDPTWRHCANEDRKELRVCVRGEGPGQQQQQQQCGLECQVGGEAGTGVGWTGSSSHDAVGEAHIARRSGQVIGSLQVLVGDLLWHYPVYGTSQQCHRNNGDKWELVLAGQGWHTTINSVGELVTMSSDNMAGTEPSSSTCPRAQKPQGQTSARTHSSIYGFKIVNKGEGKVRRLLPVFTNSRSNSARDISNNVTFRVKGDSTWQTHRPNRNSDMCDVQMYRECESRAATPAPQDDGDGSTFIRLCGVTLGSRPPSPDPYPLFRCNTLPRKMPQLQLSSLPSWTQETSASVVTSPESEVSFSEPMSPQTPQVLCTGVQDTAWASVVLGESERLDGAGGTDGGDAEGESLRAGLPQSAYHNVPSSHSLGHRAAGPPPGLPEPPATAVTVGSTSPSTGDFSGQLVHHTNVRSDSASDDIPAKQHTGALLQEGRPPGLGLEVAASRSSRGGGQGPPPQQTGSEKLPVPEVCTTGATEHSVNREQEELIPVLPQVSTSKCNTAGDTVVEAKGGVSPSMAEVVVSGKGSGVVVFPKMTSADTPLCATRPPPTTPPPDESPPATPAVPSGTPAHVTLREAPYTLAYFRIPVKKPTRDEVSAAASESVTAVESPEAPPVELKIIESSSVAHSQAPQVAGPAPPVTPSSQGTAMPPETSELGPSPAVREVEGDVLRESVVSTGTQVYSTPERSSQVLTTSSQTSQKQKVLKQPVAESAELSHSATVPTGVITTSVPCQTQEVCTEKVSLQSDSSHSEMVLPEVIISTAEVCDGQVAATQPSAAADVCSQEMPCECCSSETRASCMGSGVEGSVLGEAATTPPSLTPLTTNSSSSSSPRLHHHPQHTSRPNSLVTYTETNTGNKQLLDDTNSICKDKTSVTSKQKREIVSHDEQRKVKKRCVAVNSKEQSCGASECSETNNKKPLIMDSLCSGVSEMKTRTTDTGNDEERVNDDVGEDEGVTGGAAGGGGGEGGTSSGLSGSQEGRVGVVETGAGVVGARGQGVSEKAALITLQQQQVAARGHSRPRPTRFPLDIICGSKHHQQRSRQRAPEGGYTRQRLSSLGHVQPLTTPADTSAAAAPRSKSASRILQGSGHALPAPVSPAASGAQQPQDSTDGEPPVTPTPPSVLPLDPALQNKIQQTINSCSGNVTAGNASATAGTTAGQTPSEKGGGAAVTVHSSPCQPPPETADVAATAPAAAAPAAAAVIKSTPSSQSPPETDCVPEVKPRSRGTSTVDKTKVCVVVGESNETNTSELLPPHSESLKCETTSLSGKNKVEGVRTEFTHKTIDKTAPLNHLQGEVKSKIDVDAVVVETHDQQQLEQQEQILQQKQEKHQPEEQQPLEEECKTMRKEGEEREATDPAYSTPLEATSTTLRHKTPPTQTPTLNPAHQNHAPRRASLLLNYESNLQYIDECESGVETNGDSARETSEGPSTDTASDDATSEAGDGLMKGNVSDVEGDLRGSSSVGAVPQPPTHSPSQPGSASGETPVKGSEDEAWQGDSGRSQEVVHDPVLVVVTDMSESSTAAVCEGSSSTSSSRGLGRDESLDEYELALDVVTPEPSQDEFSHSSASLATVVRVDTPSHTPSLPPPPDDEAEDEFVDASDGMDLCEGGVQQVGVTPDTSHQSQISVNATSSSSQSIPTVPASATPQEKVLSVSTGDTQSSGVSHTSSLDVCCTQAGSIGAAVSVSTSGGDAESSQQDSRRQSLTTRRTESDVPEDGSLSSGGHITDPDMLASASASSTGSEAWWTSGGGGPVARRDLLPLDEDEEEAKWRALLAVNLPESEEEPTGYESDEDFDAMDADMRRLEEKLKKFERELAGSNERDMMFEGGEKKSGSITYAPRLRSQDLESLKISLPKMLPAVRSAKTKHLSLMTRLEVQEYGDSASESESESEAASSSDSADFLFVKTKIKLKPGDRRCRSFEQKRPKDYNILNRSHESKRRGSKVRDSSCICEEQLDLSSFNLLEETLDEKVECDVDTNQTVEVSALPPPPSNLPDETLTPVKYPGDDAPQEWCTKDDTGQELQASAELDEPRPNGKCHLLTEEKEPDDVVIYGGDDNLLLGYIWQEDDGMAAVDFEGLEDFQSFEGQGALMIMFEDDLDDDVLIDEFGGARKSGEQEDAPPVPPPAQYLTEESGSGDSSSSHLPGTPHRSHRGSEKTFVSAFKNSLRKASKYLGPKSESRVRKASHSTSQSPEYPPYNTTSSSVTTTHLPDGSCYPDRRCSMGVAEESNAGVYNVQSGRVAPVPTFPLTSDSEGPDAFSCSSGEYYATPALCVNTSDEDPAVAATAVGVTPSIPIPQGQQFQLPNFPDDVPRPVVDTFNQLHDQPCPIQDTHGPVPPVDESSSPPVPPPRWVQRRSYAPQDVEAGVITGRLTCNIVEGCYCHAVVPPPVQPPPIPAIPTPCPPVTHSLLNSTTHNRTSAELPTDGYEMQFCVVGVPNTVAEGDKATGPVVPSGAGDSLREDGGSPEAVPPPLPAPPDPHLYCDNYVPTGAWIPENYPRYSVPSTGNYSCVVPNHRCVRGDGAVPVGPPTEADPTTPSHKPTSVKQLKRRQHEKVLRHEAEEGMASKGCTFCMGVPLRRGRPPEDSAHWRQPSPHPRAIGDRRSWPPRVSCLVPLTRWSLPTLITCSSVSSQPQTSTATGQPCFCYPEALTSPPPPPPASHLHQHHDQPQLFPHHDPPCVYYQASDSADSQISLGEGHATDTSTHYCSHGPTSSPGSDSDPYWMPVMHLLGSRRHYPLPLASLASAEVTHPCSASSCPPLTSPASLTTDLLGGTTVGVEPHHTPLPWQLTPELWTPSVEHIPPPTCADAPLPLLTSDCWTPTVDSYQMECDASSYPADCWTPLVDPHPSQCLQEELKYNDDTQDMSQGAPEYQLPTHTLKPARVSTSALDCWPEALHHHPLTPSPLTFVALTSFSCPLLIFASVLDLTGENVLPPEHGRACGRALGSQNPQPPLPAHTHPPQWAVVASSTSSVERDPSLKYSASESDVDSG